MSVNTHPDWVKENSLTAPEDRNPEKIWRPEQGAPSLTENEVEEAMKELNVKSFIEKFPRVDRTYQDPPVNGQNIFLFSFTPAKGATPNEKGVYGFAKVRGSYATPIESEQRAEYIIRNVDSFHKLFHGYVGRPFPITYSSDYSAETSEIDIRKEMTSAISSHIKEKKEEDKRIINEIKEREQKLTEESRKAQQDDGLSEVDEDPYEKYITLCVKKAQLSWNFLEHIKKLTEIRDIIIRTRKEIKSLDETYPDFRDKYFKKYMQARESSGFNDKNIKENFLRFMVEDISIPTIDTDEVLPSIEGKLN